MRNESLAPGVKSYTTISVTNPVDDPVNNLVNNSVTKVVNYLLFLIYIERL